MDLHGRHPQNSDLHEWPPQNSFQDHGLGTDFIKKIFHTIFRSMSVGSISNEMDPEGKTKIIMMLQIKLPHHNGIDNLKVKVDNGAEANILPLDSFRTMFPHALDEWGYPKKGFLHGSRTNLECYGNLELRLQHYSENSFQDHTFYDVETRMLKDIIIGMPASSRLGLVNVLCKN